MTEQRPTVVHLMRHGEVNNPSGVLYARLPGFHLTDRGRRMAGVVGDYFANSQLTHLASSPLERARETLEAIATHHPDLEAAVDDNLIEADSEFRGQTFGSKNLALRNPRNWSLLRNPLRPSWGEPYAQIAERMLVAIRDGARAAGVGGEAVLVSHQSPIEIVRRAVQGTVLAHLPNQRRCTLASITTFEVDADDQIRFTGYVEPAIGLVGHKAGGSPISAGR